MINPLGVDGQLSIAILSQSWQLCATPPGHITALDQIDETLPWKDIARPECVAAILKSEGQWTIDDTNLRFDALDWWYKWDFALAEHTKFEHLALEFDGLATIAEVWLNGEILLKSNNMFLKHQIQAGSKLSAAGNQLLLVFRSLDQQLKQRYPRPRWRSPMMEHQQLRQIRTTALGRTPGWSPPFQIVGPWRPIRLHLQPALSVSDLRINTHVSNSNGFINLSFKLTGSAAQANDIAHIELLANRENQKFSGFLHYNVTTQTYAACLQIDDVQLWWPHTHGEPALYNAEFRISRKSTPAISVYSLGCLGFRHIEVNREQGNFSILINDVKVFCRGAVWMPIDPTTLNNTEEEYLTALNQVKAAGMNMLRISGVTSYETEVFYKLCDQLGIMIWQEFMFAGMDYPEDPEFVASVTTEAQQQLSIWQAHPSIIILCGNAEVEQQSAMWGANRLLWTSSPLFYQLLSDLSRLWCPTVFYWPSANHDGAFPHQCDVGTSFYYGFGAYLRPLEDARLSNLKFATECLAIANVPEISNLKLLPGGKIAIPKVHHPAWKMRSPRDLGGAGWDFDDIRDFYLAYFFKLDPLKLRYSDHERYLILSKVTSGEMMAKAFAEWRSKFSACNGALIWFLRDLWPGAGWGVLDSSGHPKSCYYYLQRTLQPLSVTLSDEASNGYYVHINNESPHAQTVIAEVLAYKSGHILVASGSRTLELEARGHYAEPLGLWFDTFIDLNFSYRFGPAITDSIYFCLKSIEGNILAETFAFPDGLASLPTADLGLQANVRLLENGDAVADISCQRLALAINFEVEGFIPDDAYFHLAPKHTKQIIFRNIQKQPKGLYAHMNAINALDSVSLSASVS